MNFPQLIVSMAVLVILALLQQVNGSSPPEAAACMSECTMMAEQDYTLLTVNEIINGKDNEFPGLIPLIHKYLSSVDVDADTHCTIQQYLKLIQKRASGELKTTARWIRDFVLHHENYNQDSVVSENITYDLLKKINLITQGDEDCPELLNSTRSKTYESIPKAIRKAENSYSSNKKNDLSDNS